MRHANSPTVRIWVQKTPAADGRETSLLHLAKKLAHHSEREETVTGVMIDVTWSELELAMSVCSRVMCYKNIARHSHTGTDHRASRQRYTRATLML